MFQFKLIVFIAKKKEAKKGWLKRWLKKVALKDGCQKLFS